MKKGTLIIVGLLAVAAVALAIVIIPKLNSRTGLPPVTSKPPVSSQAPTTEARFSAVLTSALGRVEVQKSGGAWSPAATGLRLEKGDTIRTGESAVATVTFFDGSTVELKFATEVLLLELNQQANQTTITLGQQVGQTVSRVTQFMDSASRYDVETPAAVAAVRGSEMFVSVETDGLTLVGNIEGDIRAIAEGVEIKIPEGMHSVIYPGKAPGSPRASANPIVYRTPVMLDSADDLFGKDGSQVTGAGYLDILRAQASVYLVGLTDGEIVLRMDLKAVLPEASDVTGQSVEWDFFTDVDRNPVTGLRWPLVANDLGYDFLVQLRLQNGQYQARLFNAAVNTWIPIEYSIQGDMVEMYMDIQSIIPSVGGLVITPGDLYWLVATMLYNAGDVDNQPSVADKAPNQGHYNLLP